MSMAALGANQKPPEDYFTNIVLKVNTRSKKWQKSLAAVLNNIQDIKNFVMDNDGRVEVSGMIHPIQLLAMLGKSGEKARVTSWGFGQCSKSLEFPQQPKKKKLEYDFESRQGYGPQYGYDTYENTSSNCYYDDNTYIMSNNGYGYGNNGYGYGYGCGEEYPNQGGYGNPVPSQPQGSSSSQSQAQTFQRPQPKAEYLPFSERKKESFAGGMSSFGTPDRDEGLEMPECCTVM